ncbi:DUF3138 family protein, partial [Paraburkholderia oxyphila]|uniref:DUF3138 family protein n=1 Tax=Paraburkholderia oxyphila TaxID=614212 RepID=UPI003898E303
MSAGGRGTARARFCGLDQRSDQGPAAAAQRAAKRGEIAQERACASNTGAKGTAKSAGASTGAAATVAAAAPAQEVDMSSPDYGKQPAHLTNDDVDSMKQQIASQQLKVDSLSDAANTGPIAGLSVTGYIDPTYI